MHVLKEERQETAVSITSCATDTEQGLPSTSDGLVRLLAVASEPITVKCQPITKDAPVFIYTDTNSSITEMQKEKNPKTSIS